MNLSDELVEKYLLKEDLVWVLLTAEEMLEVVEKVKELEEFKHNYEGLCK